MRQLTILGAGISGLATAYHAGHDRSEIFEAASVHSGHVRSHSEDGFTWDDGPHVSFTNSEHVQRLFSEAVDGAFEEKAPIVSNYFRGHWIDHPAQSNLYQVPEPLRTQCLESFLEMRANDGNLSKPTDYQQWIEQAFGKVFANTFPAAYTRKYWAAEPRDLGVDWIGKRVFYPAVEDVRAGYEGPLGRSTYWVQKFRYPSRGGFGAFTEVFAKGANIHYDRAVQWIDFDRRLIGLSSGDLRSYDALVTTLPIPSLIRMSQDAPDDVREAAEALRATDFYLIEIAARHPSVRRDHWLYVYDEEKLSTRVLFMEHLAASNAPAGTTAMEVEVCGSAYRPLTMDRGTVKHRVEDELIEMGLVESREAIISSRIRHVPWGQVIYDHRRRAALDVIMPFLQRMDVVSVGRYAEWGYLMTDHCVLKAKRAVDRLDQGMVEDWTEIDMERV